MARKINPLFLVAVSLLLMVLVVLFWQSDAKTASPQPTNEIADRNKGSLQSQNNAQAIELKPRVAAAPDLTPPPALSFAINSKSEDIFGAAVVAARNIQPPADAPAFQQANSFEEAAALSKRDPVPVSIRTPGANPFGVGL